jgi:hypothetical protein
MRSPRRNHTEALAADNASDLLTASFQWGDHPDVRDRLRTLLAANDDVVRAVALRGLLHWNPREAITDDLSDVAADECPAVREMAADALATPGRGGADRRWADDPDPSVRAEVWLSGTMLAGSARHADQLLRIGRELGDRVPYDLLERLAVWAGTGQIDPQWLLSSEVAPRFSSADHSWLEWLAWSRIRDAG